MSNEITNTKNQTFSLAPRNLEEAMKYADILSKSSIIPKDFKGKAGDILVAVQMGSEIGLPPIQALQNIAVINGRPSVWGDAALAICQSHPKYKSIEESLIESKDGNHKAVCIVKRKGEDEYKVTFSVEDAKKAGLWGRQGPWSTYPKRMLQMRARGFALRDKFSDALKGMITREEAEDTPRGMKNVTEERIYLSKADKLAETIESKMIESNENEIINDINETTPILEKMISRLYELGSNEKEVLSTLKVKSIEDITNDHIKDITEMGMKLRECE